MEIKEIIKKLKGLTNKKCEKLIKTYSWLILNDRFVILQFYYNKIVIQIGYKDCSRKITNDEYAENEGKIRGF
ncbi:MAG: hypothetical protein AABY22_07510 [Nanoarchaeota archaeon]